MSVNKVISLSKRAEDEEKPFFEQLLHEGARKLLQAAIENGIIEYIQFHKDRRDENGHGLVVRNGHLPEREIISGLAPLKSVNRGSASCGGRSQFHRRLRVDPLPDVMSAVSHNFLPMLENCHTDRNSSLLFLSDHTEDRFIPNVF